MKSKQCSLPSGLGGKFTLRPPLHQTLLLICVLLFALEVNAQVIIPQAINPVNGEAIDCPDMPIEMSKMSSHPEVYTGQFDGLHFLPESDELSNLGDLAATIKSIADQVRCHKFEVLRVRIRTPRSELPGQGKAAVQLLAQARVAALKAVFQQYAPIPADQLQFVSHVGIQGDASLTFELYPQEAWQQSHADTHADTIPMARK
jgi:hypothetical protein